MSKSITYKNLHSEYHALMANGAILPDWTDERAAEMLIYKLNRQADSIVEGGSTFLTDEIEWSDFLPYIFSGVENLERTETGFEYRAIVEDACAQSLRTFIGKIKKVETKLALLKFFLTDDFRQNVLNKGYCAYGSSADMIQLQCAKLMGEINRSLHGEVAPDLADITDDIAADAGDEPVNSEQDIKKIIDSLPTKKMLINEKVVEIYQLPKDEEITPIGKLIASVNKGEVQARKADWKHLVQEGFRAEQTSPMTFMYWMQESLTDIKIRDYRVDALHTILENLPAYLQELEAPDDVQNRYKQDCMNLLHYFRQINYIVPYFDEAGRYWNEHRDDDQLDVETYLYFRFLDQIDDLKEYLAFSQAHYVAIHAKTHSFIPNIVAAQSEPYWDKLVTEDIIGFCSSLYMAETTRQKFLHGWKNPYPALTIDSFPLRLRNRCFDYYIQYRKKEVMDELLSSNRRLHEPNELECLQTLMDEEQQSYNRLKGMEQFRGSEAFARVWKAGTPDILAMADFFLQYLAEKLPLASHTDLGVMDEMGIIQVPELSKEDVESYYSKPFCNFNFLNHEFRYDYPGSPYCNNWLWKDQSGDITFTFEEMEHITNTLPSPQPWEVKKWLRMYLKNHPAITIDMLDEVYGEVQRLADTYLGEYLRREKNGLWGIEYGGPYDNVFSRIGLNVWKDVFESYTSVSPAAQSPSSPQQQEEKQDCQWDVVDKAFNFSHTIQELVVEMAKTCTKPWHYACMIAVLDDYNLVKDRYAYTAIADALKEWSIIVNPNSLGYKLSDLPSDFHSLDQKAWKKEYNKCVALENSISTRNGYTYRHKKS